MHRQRQKRKIVIFVLIGLLFVMGIGYSAFSSNLKISGNTKITSNWDVEITGVSAPTLNGSAEEVNVPTYDKLSASMNVNLYEPGDSVEYDVTISNLGTIDATLDNYTLGTSTSSMIVTFSNFTKGEIIYKKGHSNSTKNIHVKIEYNPEYSGGEVSEETSITFNFKEPEVKEVTNDEVISKDKYLVTYDCTTNGGTACTNFNEYLLEGDSVDLTKTPSIPGYDFIGWNTNSQAETGLSSYTITDQNVTMYAIFKIQDQTPPVIDSFATIRTSNSIKVIATAHDDESEISKYEFSNDNGSTWVDNGTNPIYTFTSLTTGQSYNIKVRVTNEDSLETISNSRTVIPLLDTPTFVENVSEGTTIVEIAYPKGCGDILTCTYQKNSEASQTVNNEIVSVPFTDSGTLIATVSDGVNNVSSTYTVTFLSSPEEVVETYTTSGSSTFVAPVAGDYYLQVWGAQGYSGGKGGYSYGTVTLNKNDTLYVYVGGQPTSTYTTGGFNGGGTGGKIQWRKNSSSSYSTKTTKYGGGGGTDIRINSDSLYARVIVAGGGAGSSSSYVGGGESGTGKASGYYGTQTGGYSFGKGKNGSSGSYTERTYKTRYNSGGGGGGWYGGSSYSVSTSSTYSNYNGGGSGYVYTSATASNYPSGCLLTSDYYLKDAATIAGNVEFESPSGGTETGHAGNGYAKITYVRPGVNENEPVPTISTTKTTHSITAVMNTNDVSSEIIKYEFSKDGGNSWVESNNSTYVFNSLTTNSYTIKGRVTISSGVLLVTGPVTVTLDSIEMATFSSELFDVDDGDVTITYPEGCGSTYTCTYTKDLESPVTVTSTTTVVHFTADGEVGASITDGTNTVSNSYTVIMPLDAIDDYGPKMLVIGDGDGLYSDAYGEDDTSYFFRGADPNNYIDLGSSGLYRIMSIDTSGNIKVIKDTPLSNTVWDPGYSTSISGITSSSSTAGTRYSSSSSDYCYISSASSYYGCKSWGSNTSTLNSAGTSSVTQMPWEAGSATLKNLPTYDSYLNVYLNGGTYPTTSGTTTLTSWYSTNVDSSIQSKMINHLWNVGPVASDSSLNLAQNIGQEAAYKWSGKVGLMTATDYVRASTNSACTNVYSYTQSSCYNNSSTHNWLYKNSHQWTMAPYSDPHAIYVWSAYSSGAFTDYDFASNAGGVRPVLYLSSSIRLKGKGTSAEPYYVYTEPTSAAKATLTKLGQTAKEYGTTDGDGIYEDNEGGYYYRGANPSNYINLGSDLYRIMSIDTSGNLKVIKDTPLSNTVWDPGYSTSISGITSSSSTAGTRYSSSSSDYCYTSSASSYYGCKSWGSKTSTLNSAGTSTVTQMPWEVGSSTLKNLPTYDSYINVYLNGGTYPTTSGTTTLSSWYSSNVASSIQSKLVTHLWNVGPVSSSSSYTLAQNIGQEAAYKWSGKVGLMTATDYVRASTNSACTNVYNYYSTSSCYNNSSTHNWLYKSSDQWTMAPPSYSNASNFVNASSTYLNYYGALHAGGVRPVFYLASCTRLSGSGTSGNPYTIAADVGSCSGDPDPSPATNYVYAYHTDNRTIGTSVVTDGVSDYTELISYHDGIKWFLKYELDGNNVIQNAWACMEYDFINEPVCLQGGNTSYYASNRGIIEGLASTFTSNGGSCSADDSEGYCDVYNYYVASGSFGDAESGYQEAGEKCYVGGLGDVKCSER